MATKKSWINTFASWLIDVSKYLMTGVLLSSVFKDMENKFVLYIVGAGVCLLLLIIGLSLKNDNK